MKQDKCNYCKYYKEGLDIDYVPSCWCKLDNFDNAETCERYKEEYTLGDYIEDILPGIVLVLCLTFVAFFMNLISK